MPFVSEKLPGLNRDLLVSAIEPVIVAYGVAGLELTWKRDRSGMVLEVVVENATASEPGLGITLDLCADISRELSAAIDALDCIPGKFRLEVGSPGVERKLYAVADGARFAGKPARIRYRDLDGTVDRWDGVLVAPPEGEAEGDRIWLERNGEVQALLWERILSARLAFQWGTDQGASPNGKKAGKSRASAKK